MFFLQKNVHIFKNMKKQFFFYLFLISSTIAFSQEGFKINSSKREFKLSFKLINNLIIIPVNLNGVELNFLLDTGVEKTILFSADEKSTIEFKDVEKIKIKGLGTGESVDAYHAKNNFIKIGKYEDHESEIYIILDENINFSSQLGIPVHGIIGSNFFRNDLIEIDYATKKIIILDAQKKSTLKKLKKFAIDTISIELEKPYIQTLVNINGNDIATKMLIDTGGSDALWLFENGSKIKAPEQGFSDFLGKGFSGDVFGKRSRIESLKITNCIIDQPTASFPDLVALKNVIMVENRNGSIGAEVLRRFSVIFDYKNGKIYFKKNSNFDEPFNYNMSGLEFSHDGLQMVQEKTELKTTMVSKEDNVIDYRRASVKYDFVLKPIYIISSVRPNSPGEQAGLKKDDKLIKVNGMEAYHYKLDGLNQLMRSEDGKWITIEVERKGEIFKVKFQLKKLL